MIVKIESVYILYGDDFLVYTLTVLFLKKMKKTDFQGFFYGQSSAHLPF